MLPTLEYAFKNLKIENPQGQYVKLNSHTSKEQGFFLQEIINQVKPSNTLEVGLAYGISTLFILEKLRDLNRKPNSHLVIEPFPWGGVAEHNIQKEGLFDLVDIRYEKSDEVLPKLYHNKHNIQFAYIDTTKVFDTVLQDFYFVDKILDVGGVVVLDDCGGSWPGVQRVARFINSLPHYKIYATHNKAILSAKKRVANAFVTSIVSMIPFKKYFYPSFDFKTDSELRLDYSCIAFQKKENDPRPWNWDKAF